MRLLLRTFATCGAPIKPAQSIRQLVRKHETVRWPLKGFNEILHVYRGILLKFTH
jgi:hypothetical protein